MNTASLRGNRLLAKVPKGDLESLLPHLRYGTLNRDDTVHEIGRPVKLVYFPDTAVLSALTVMEDGSAIEVGTVGSEGAVGLPAFLGAPISLHRVVCQIPGTSWSVDIETLKREAKSNSPLAEQLVNYHAFFIGFLSQCVACNGLHSVQKRCCRWLLLTRDRTTSDSLPLTHEYLAIMLGVRRAGVTEVLNLLEKHALIDNSRRGEIRLIDRPKLEDLSCECYRDSKQLYEQLMGEAE